MDWNIAIECPLKYTEFLIHKGIIFNDDTITFNHDGDERKIVVGDIDNLSPSERHLINKQINELKQNFYTYTHMALHTAEMQVVTYSEQSLSALLYSRYLWKINPVSRPEFLSLLSWESEKVNIGKWKPS